MLSIFRKYSDITRIRNNRITIKKNRTLNDQFHTKCYRIKKLGKKKIIQMDFN